MTRLTFFLLGLLSCAAAAPVSPAVTGEWLLGPALPAAVYDGAYGGAATDTARLWLRPDGQYALTDIEFTYVPGFFGSYVVTCGTLTVTTESGRYQLTGDQVTFSPKQARRVTGLSPQTLNAGCKRFEGSTDVLTTQPYRGTAVLKGDSLSVSVGTARREYLTRAAAESAARPPALTASAPAVSTPAVNSGPLVTPKPWSATGDWDVVLNLSGNQLPLFFHLYDDGERSLSGSGFEQEDSRAWLLGSRDGTFDIGLDDGAAEMKLRVQGRFSGDTFTGTFHVLDEDGQPLASGGLVMQRRSSP